MPASVDAGESSGAQVEEELDITPHCIIRGDSRNSIDRDRRGSTKRGGCDRNTKKKAEGEVEEAKVAAATTDGVRENVETPAEQETKEAAVEAEPEVEIEAVAEERVEEVVAPAEPPSEATVADEEKKEEVKQVEEEAAAA
ncbi:hypothetical protein OPV22_026474 [Ensete ventricosum]|uniref:Uncharacterized protein n=1 Tax=Ensete ventricosum TaxID=4639 RepID=A0AAV8QAD6_ENSVE|nr:hypothetical protein OPV22_026474 [Ensete ventricosum]